MRHLPLRRPSPATILAVATLTLAACGTGSGGAAPAGTEARSDKARVTSLTVSTDDAATLASDNRHFALDLYQKVRAGSADNLVFSPASISIALAMTYGGAANTTASQMAATLHFSLPPARLHPAFDALDLALESPPASADAGAFQLSLANAVWGQQGFNILPAYLDLLAEDYGAGLQLVDFGANQGETARATINQWVSDKTNAKIPNLIPSHVLDPSTRLVLTNAVYFKADWQSPFDPNSPDGTFNAPSGPVQVPMMSGHDSIAPAWSGAGYHAAALPYQGGHTSMVLIVPDAGTFDAFESGLTEAALDAILTAAPTGSALVSMPRFKFTTTLGLSDALAAMGMTDLFHAGVADLSGIDGATDLFVTAVLHQALIAVDEKGTEAAAATAVVIGTASIFGGESLVVDRPFLFAIRDDATGAIVFLGRVLDPSK
jgi:serpin B